MRSLLERHLPDCHAHRLTSLTNAAVAGRVNRLVGPFDGCGRERLGINITRRGLEGGGDESPAAIDLDFDLVEEISEPASVPSYVDMSTVDGGAYIRLGDRVVGAGLLHALDGEGLAVDSFKRWPARWHGAARGTM
jgi:hypothetical protein